MTDGETAMIARMLRQPADAVSKDDLVHLRGFEVTRTTWFT